MHHVVDWFGGGPTDVDNLVLLCRRHHVFVHEHGWSVQMTGEGPAFSRPDGKSVDHAPRLGPMDLVALQDALPVDADRAALQATGGWEPVDYVEIIDALVEVSRPR